MVRNISMECGDREMRNRVCMAIMNNVWMCKFEPDAVQWWQWCQHMFFSSSCKCFAATVVMFLQVSDWSSPLAGQQMGRPWAAVRLVCGLPFGFLCGPPHPCPSVQNLSWSASQTLGSPWLVACHSSIYCWAWCEGSWSWWYLTLHWPWSWFWSGAVSRFQQYPVWDLKLWMRFELWCCVCKKPGRCIKRCFVNACILCCAHVWCANIFRPECFRCFVLNVISD